MNFIGGAIRLTSIVEPSISLGGLAMSIINNSYKFIFIHIPKCGGTSVSNFMTKFTRYSDIEIGATDFGENIEDHYLNRFGLKKHSTARRIKIVVGDDIWNSYFKFTFVRNPFTRTISIFYFLNKWKDWPGSGIMRSFLNVNDFIISDFWASTDGPDKIFTSQSRFIGGTRMDYVGRIEALQESLRTIVTRVLLPIETAEIVLPHNNPSSTGKETVALGNRAIEKIRNRYRDDFINFGYDPNTVPNLVRTFSSPQLVETGKGPETGGESQSGRAAGA